MSTLVADFINFFDSQVVQNSSGHSVWAILLCLVTVPAQTLQNSFGSAVYALPLVFLIFFIVLRKVKDSKTKGMPKLLNNNKMEDEE